jgi:hypothetical protein
MLDIKYSGQQARLENVLGSSGERLGRESGYVQRESKLTARLFVQAVVLTWLEKPSGSLTDVAQSCGEVGVRISEAGIQQRIGASAVRLLEGVLRQLPTGILGWFTAIYLLDGRSISLPLHLKGLFAGKDYRGQQASAKIWLSFDYKAGRIAALEVVGGCEADQTCQQHVQLAHVGSLHLFNLGFFKQQVFAALSEAGAFFISRWQTQTGVYASGPDGVALEQATLLEKAAVLGELDVALGSQTRLAVRLVFEKLPDKLVAQRRRTVQAKARRKGYTCSARHLSLLAWSIFITNVPQAWLSPRQIIVLYRLRWQVELIFKLWKSQAKLDQIAHCGPHRFLCQFYARLLTLLVFHWLLDDFCLSDPTAQLSLPKAFSIIQRYAARLRTAFAAPTPTWQSLLALLVQDVQRLAKKQKRRTSPSTLSRILSLNPLA